MQPVFHYALGTSVQTLHRLVQRALSLACLAVGLALIAVSQTPGISDVSVAIHRVAIPQIHSYTEVNAFAQDRSGYIWMGTSNGLSRYDGQNCILFEHDPLDSNSLSDNGILSLLADTSGVLWVGTRRGLDRFDPTTTKWTRYLHDSENDSSVSHDRINTIYEDRTGVLWVGTAHGLNRFERKSGTFKRYFPAPVDSSRPGESFIGTVLEDREGTFWVGTGKYGSQGGGLFTFDRKSESFSRFRRHRSDPVDLSGDWITSLFEDGSGNLWISTSPGGVARIDKRSGTLTHLSLSGSVAGKNAPMAVWALA
jgi:ligand-binding sensor domain-containing protein